MNAADQSAAFARLMLALKRYRGDLVLIGGWAHRLSRLHPLAQSVDFQPLFTYDIDLAIPRKVPPKQEELGKLLAEAGFTGRFLGEEHPPVIHYHLGGEPTFYAEFLTPLVGRPAAATSMIAGVSAQALRYLEILMIAPWSVPLSEPEYPVGSTRLEVRIANPASYLAQKLLVLSKRDSADRAKDVLYLHDTLMMFGRSLDELERIWIDKLSSSIHQTAARALRRAPKVLFSDVTDAVRGASRVAKETGRPLSADEIAQVCRIGLAKVFS